MQTTLSEHFIMSRWLLMFIFITGSVHAEERTPDVWFALAISIQREIEQADFEHRSIKNIDAEDRRFVRKMINELSVSQEAQPTAAQGQWLLAIQAWVNAK